MSTESDPKKTNINNYPNSYPNSGNYPSMLDQAMLIKMMDGLFNGSGSGLIILCCL